MKRQSLFIIFILIIFSSFHTVDMSTSTLYPNDKKRSSPAGDFLGIYRGVLPCADCAGVLTEIEIKPSGQCKIGRRYLSNSGDILIKNGTYDWDISGTVITLHIPDELDHMNLYKVGENQLVKLDNEGHEIEGDLAKLYTLTKAGTDHDIKNTYWQLTELEGKPIPQNKKNLPYFVVFPNHQIIGNTGCNSFIGKYNMDDFDDFRVSIVAMTLHACSDAIYETGFMNVFDRAQKFDLEGDVLSLKQEGRAPFAKFRPIYFK